MTRVGMSPVQRLFDLNCRQVAEIFRHVNGGRVLMGQARCPIDNTTYSHSWNVLADGTLVDLFNWTHHDPTTSVDRFPLQETRKLIEWVGSGEYDTEQVWLTFHATYSVALAGQQLPTPA